MAPRAPDRSGRDTLASSGSCHRAKAAAFHRTSGSSRCRLTRAKWRWPAPFAPRALHPLHRYYEAVRPRRIGTFGLAVGAARAFSLGIADQVLTLHPRAWL